MNWDFSKQTKRLNESVEKSGLTLKELSEQTGISVRTLKDYLAGKRYPKMKSLSQIRKVLGVSFDYLLFPEKFK